MANGIADPIERLLESTSIGDGDLLVCKHCGNPITSAGESIEIATSHRYRFTNPAGITFSIGCYRHAPGCTIFGEATSQDSWFGGYRWQIASCSECQQHLGWYYQNQQQRSFFGLIPDRLTARSSSDQA